MWQYCIIVGNVLIYNGIALIIQLEKVFTKDELETVAGACNTRDLLAIIDEVYEHITYDKKKHISLASLSGMQKNYHYIFIVKDMQCYRSALSDLGYHQDDSNSVSLPILKSLQLWDPPRLKSIYNGEMVCQSIEEVDVHGCPMVRRLPSLKYIRGQEEWWESLEWEDAHTKTILQPFLEISSY